MTPDLVYEIGQWLDYPTLRNLLCTSITFSNLTQTEKIQRLIKRESRTFIRYVPIRYNGSSLWQAPGDLPNWFKLAKSDTCEQIVRRLRSRLDEYRVWLRSVNLCLNYRRPLFGFDTYKTCLSYNLLRGRVNRGSTVRDPATPIVGYWETFIQIEVFCKIQQPIMPPRSRCSCRECVDTFPSYADAVEPFCFDEWNPANFLVGLGRDVDDFSLQAHRTFRVRPPSPEPPSVCMYSPESRPSHDCRMRNR